MYRFVLPVSVVKSQMKYAAISLAVIGVSACASTSYNTAKTIDAPRSKTSVEGEYLKAHFAARSKNYPEAASLYRGLAQNFTQSTDINRQAFYMSLIAGDVDKSSIYAARLDQIIDENATVQGESTSALDRLVNIADGFKSNDQAKIDQHLDGEWSNAFDRSIGHLLASWSVYGTDGALVSAEFIAKPKGEVFSGFSYAHQAMMFEADGEIDRARHAHKRAIQGHNAQTAILNYAHFLERQAKKDPKAKQEAIDLYRKMAGDINVLSRAGRLGLIRLGEALPMETASSKRMAGKTPQLPKNMARYGAAMAFYDFAFAGYEQSMTEYQAAQRSGFRHVKPRLDNAMSFINVAILIDPKNDSFRYMKGTIYHAQELHDLAFVELEKVTPASPYYEYAQRELADIYLDQDQDTKAIKLYSDFVNADPSNAGALRFLTNVLIDTEQYEQAQDVARRAITIAEAESALENDAPKLYKKDLGQFYFAYGVALAEDQKWDAAELALQKARTLMPNEYVVLNYLGYSWAERGKNLDEAFAMLEKAISLAPNSAAVTDSMGWAHYQRGNYAEAVEYLEKAVKMDPTDAVLSDHLGDAYWQIGLQNHARYEWGKALLNDPKAALEAKLKIKIEQGLT